MDIQVFFFLFISHSNHDILCSFGPSLWSVYSVLINLALVTQYTCLFPFSKMPSWRNGMSTMTSEVLLKPNVSDMGGIRLTSCSGLVCF